MIIILLLLHFFSYTKSTEITLPRGISLSQGALYNSLEDFTCLDGSLRLPFVFVNDDYCDCQDGSDEPGTSACPNGRFYCQNVGFVPLDLPASRVNDGVCDCCDASDEYISENCTNICHILGTEAKRAAEKEAEIISQGSELRLQMVAAGKQIKQQKQERLTALEAEKLEASTLKEEASRLKQMAESAEYEAMEIYRVRKQEQKEALEKLEKEKLDQEAQAIFKILDSNGDNVLQNNELIKDVFDQNKDGDVSDDELKFFFNTNDGVSWDSFLDVWPKVKPFFFIEKEHEYAPLDQNVADIKEDRASETTEDTPVNTSYLDDSLTNMDHEVGEEWDGQKTDEKEQHAEQEHDEDEEEEDKQDEEEKQEEELEESKNEDKYDEHTLKLIDEANQARSRFESAERTMQDIEREITRLKDSLEKDYGPDGEFIPLDGQCYSYSDREYTYKLCPFDQVVQMGKSGGSETRLGVWAGWLENSQYNSMLYDKGQTCWNGPQRSTKVTLLCGLETAVIGASEPNKCEYELTMKTPAVCKFSPAPAVHTHDEF